MKITNSSADQERRALVTRLLHEEFGTLQPIWVERHLALLSGLRQIFGNDLDTPIILAVIGQYMFENTADVMDRYTDHLNEAQQAHPARLTNIGSVATSAKLPRESVRRKVGELIDAGWLKRNENGGLLVTAKAAERLDPTTHEVFRLLTDIFLAMVSALENRGEAQLVQTSSDKR